MAWRRPISPAAGSTISPTTRSTVTRRLRSGVALAALPAVLLGLAGCGVDDSFSTSTLPPIPNATTAATAADAAATDATAPASGGQDASGPKVPRVTGDGCAFPSASATGSSDAVTYVLSGSLFQLGADASTATCLRTITIAAGARISWSPAGDRFLAGPTQVIDRRGAHSTGFRADNTGVRWSADGADIFAPAVGDGTLLRRAKAQSNARQDISFLARTTAAVAHPSGTVLLAAGTSSAGGQVVAMADIDGKQPRNLLTFSSTVSLPELTVAPTGDAFAVLVIGQGATAGTSVRVVHLPGLDVTNALQFTGSAAMLTQSGNSVAVRVGDCAGRTSVRLYNGTAAIDLSAESPFTGRSTLPVGFVGDRLIVEARAKGCTGSADVWSVDPDDPGSAQLLVSGVDMAAVRPGRGEAPSFPDGLNPVATEG